MYSQWCQIVEVNALQYLKVHILATNIPIQVNGQSTSLALDNKQQNNIIEEEYMYVNFKPELAELIKETKYIDKLGYSVPESALNIALQVNIIIYKKNILYHFIIYIISLNFNNYAT